MPKALTDEGPPIPESESATESAATASMILDP